MSSLDQSQSSVKQDGQQKTLVSDPIVTELLMDILAEMRKMNFQLSLITDVDSEGLEFIGEGL